jgi:hypothetical protein
LAEADDLLERTNMALLVSAIEDALGTYRSVAKPHPIPERWNRLFARWGCLQVISQLEGHGCLSNISCSEDSLSLQMTARELVGAGRRGRRFALLTNQSRDPEHVLLAMPEVIALRVNDADGVLVGKWGNLVGALQADSTLEVTRSDRIRIRLTHLEKHSSQLRDLFYTLAERLLRPM